MKEKVEIFKFPQWKPNPKKSLEISKYIKEFKKINNL